MTATLSSPLKYHGGKTFLASRIVALMPPHLHYVEPFAGGLSVLLAKDPLDHSEVVNDLDGRLTNFWRVLQDEKLYAGFHRIMEAMPFSEIEWQEADARVEREGPQRQLFEAVAFFVRCRMSLAGRQDRFAPLSRRRIRRGMNEQVSAWLTTVEGLPAVHARLRQVVVLNRPAVEVIRSQDGPGTLFYLDPPYLPGTREAKSVYQFEMSEEEHRELLKLICQVQGKVLLSGYPSDLYDEALAGWNRHTFDLPNNAAGGDNKDRETEVVWCNF